MLRKMVIMAIRSYQFFSRLTPPVCRFYPTCSHYTAGAVERYGVIKGSRLALTRISKCHPFLAGGYDPIP